MSKAPTMRVLLAVPIVLTASAATAAPVTYQLPEETAAFAPGPNLDVAQANCGACHSADYVSTQPRGLPNPTAFWSGEVTKMRNVYKAQIDEKDVPAIVAYLVAAYGK